MAEVFLSYTSGNECVFKIHINCKLPRCSNKKTDNVIKMYTAFEQTLPKEINGQQMNMKRYSTSLDFKETVAIIKYHYIPIKMPKILRPCSKGFILFKWDLYKNCKRCKLIHSHSKLINNVRLW